MAKKFLYRDNYRIEITVATPLFGIRDANDAQLVKQWGEDLKWQILRHCDNVNTAQLLSDEVFVCEFCGRTWEDVTNNFNGCCDQDSEAEERAMDHKFNFVSREEVFMAKEYGPDDLRKPLLPYQSFAVVPLYIAKELADLWEAAAWWHEIRTLIISDIYYNINSIEEMYKSYDAAIEAIAIHWRL